MQLGVVRLRVSANIMSTTSLHLHLRYLPAKAPLKSQSPSRSHLFTDLRTGSHSYALAAPIPPHMVAAVRHAVAACRRAYRPCRSSVTAVMGQAWQPWQRPPVSLSTCRTPTPRCSGLHIDRVVICLEQEEAEEEE